MKKLQQFLEKSFLTVLNKLLSKSVLLPNLSHTFVTSSHICEPDTTEHVSYH